MITDPFDPMGDPMSEVAVTEARYEGGTLAFGWGIDEEGREVRFTGEPRYLHDIALALEAGEDPIALVPFWAIQVVLETR